MHYFNKTQTSDIYLISHHVVFLGSRQIIFPRRKTEFLQIHSPVNQLKLLPIVSPNPTSFECTCYGILYGSDCFYLIWTWFVRGELHVVTIVSAFAHVTRHVFSIRASHYCGEVFIAHVIRAFYCQVHLVLDDSLRK